MPPKAKRPHSCHATATCHVCCNPRVVIGPFLPDGVTTRRQQTSLPPTAALYNQPELSDVVVRVGGARYYGHRVVLSAGSDVLARMLSPSGVWRENKEQELVLEEESACARVFDRFLYYFYTGTFEFGDSSIIYLFKLADKYAVKGLYSECAKVIEDSLKVYKVYKPGGGGSCSSGSDCEDSSGAPAGGGGARLEVHLMASETFTLPDVLHILHVSEAAGHAALTAAALANLTARLASQLAHDCHAAWSELSRPLVQRLLADTAFYCPEALLLRAVRAWLAAHGGDAADSEALLPLIRYPLLEKEHLYEAERDPALKASPAAGPLVTQACRYRLFGDCATEDDRRQWQGVQFTARQPQRTDDRRTDDGRTDTVRKPHKKLVLL